MNLSYKRYWEPSTFQVISSSLAVGTVATLATFPLEFIKTRIICRAEGIGMRENSLALGYNPFKILREFHESGRGAAGLFEGANAYLAARLSYLLVRNTIYKVLYDKFKPFKPSNDLNWKEKAVIAGIAGGIGALASNPFELIATRMIADGAIYQPHRRNLPGFIPTFQQYMQEGYKTLFRGGFSNVLRVIVLNASLTGPYDYLNEKMWITFGDIDFINNQIALVWASAWCTLATHPFDVIKVRMMKQFDDPTKNRINYKGWIDCAQKIFQYEGAFGFYSGVMTGFMRIYAYSWVTVMLMNQITGSWKKKAGLQNWQM